MCVSISPDMKLCAPKYTAGTDSAKTSMKSNLIYSHKSSAVQLKMSVEIVLQDYQRISKLFPKFPESSRGINILPS